MSKKKAGEAEFEILGRVQTGAGNNWTLMITGICPLSNFIIHERLKKIVVQLFSDVRVAGIVNQVV